MSETRRTGRRWIVLRVLVVWLVSAASIALAAAILPGITIEERGAALLVAAVLGVLNSLVWPLMIRLALPITVLTLGLGVLILNGLVFVFVADIAPGFSVHSLPQAVVAAVVVTAFSTTLSSLLAIDDDDFYYRYVVRRQARRRQTASDVPAVVFLEIDGLARDVLARAVRDGNVPTLSRWLREGTHRLLGWETDWSSQTGASQTGLLHGSNDGIPAFRWWDKDRACSVASSAPRDVMEIERRVSDGKGLLHADGASRANMYSGDAPHSLLTISTVLRRDRPGRIGQDYFAYFSNPYNFTRTIALVVADIASELWEAAQQKRLDIRPRIHRGRVYALVRAWMTVVQRDLQIPAVIGDLYQGRPVVYTTFSGYDEVAHHSGIERAETLRILRKLDRQFGRLERAAAEAPRPVRFVVLSDHGQSQGATFLQRYGRTLESLVMEACETGDAEAHKMGDEGLMYLGASATEASHATGLAAKAVRAVTRGKRVHDAVVLDPAHETRRHRSNGVPEVVVMASGCLGLIFFPREPGRLDRERLEELYPRLLPTLRDHDGIGFLLVRSAEHGPVVLGKRGVRCLGDGRVEGEDPLAPYGPNAAEKVRRTDGFANCADIVVNSTYWAETNEVAAFEELVGSHGGMGGEQSFPFLLVPAEWELPDEPLLGAAAVHRVLRRWLADLGHEAYRDRT
ncbi:MAG: phage holin family protein [Actinomycetota bacterium]|nr:phage holin family protein [Actinomycetota bacterium]